jgi:hypothetical protein
VNRGEDRRPPGWSAAGRELKSEIEIRVGLRWFRDARFQIFACVARSELLPLCELQAPGNG